MHVVSRSTRAKRSLPSLWNKLPRKGASSLTRRAGLKSLQPFYRQQVKLPGCLCQRQSPGKIYGGQNKCARRHVHTEVSLLWSCLLVGFGVGLQRCSRTGLGGGGESSKQKGALLQPSSLICPITIKHTSWHLNTPPVPGMQGLKLFFFFFFFFFLHFHFWVAARRSEDVSDCELWLVAPTYDHGVIFWKPSVHSCCGSILTLGFWMPVPVVRSVILSAVTLSVAFSDFDAEKAAKCFLFFCYFFWD